MKYLIPFKYFTGTAIYKNKLLADIRKNDQSNPVHLKLFELLADLKIVKLNGLHTDVVFEYIGQNLLRFIRY